MNITPTIPITPITPQLTDQQIAELELDNGSHDSAQAGHCLLEAVSMFAGEEFTDHPPCVDPVLADFGIGWNDGLPDNASRAQLKRYIPLLPGTAQGEALSIKRSWMAFDWLIRTHTPAWLDLSAALSEHAAQLRALDPITGQPELDRALPALERAKTAAAAAWDAARAAARDAARAAARAAAWDAARDAARAAARDAARDAARAAARDAARDAARAAAWDAARDAAWAAAWDAAWDAARDAAPGDEYKAARAASDALLAPVTLQLQASAHDLYLAMINAELTDDAFHAQQHAASEEGTAS